MKNGEKEYIRPINTNAQGGRPQNVIQHAVGATAQPQKTSMTEVTVKLCFTVLALCAAVFLISSMFVSFEFDYTPLTVASSLSTSLQVSEELLLSEDEIPPPPLAAYDFSQPVPESDPVSFGYFNNAVFIGDSRTKGLILLSEISPSYDFSASGLNVASINTKAYIRMVNEETNSPEEYTVLDALARENGNYHSIYIATGLNELGWSPDGYIQAFDTLVNNIRHITDVPIYVQLVLPITDYASQTTLFGITNEKCVAFNALIRAYANENGLFMLDPLSLFSLEDGTMASEHAIEDGIHLNRAACAVLADYYRTHVVDIYAYSNTRPIEDTEQ